MTRKSLFGRRRMMIFGHDFHSSRLSWRWWEIILFLLLLLFSIPSIVVVDAAAEIPTSKIPIIDLAPWTRSDPHVEQDGLDDTERLEVVHHIRTACETVGFFLIQNHGFDPHVAQQAWDVTRTFFQLDAMTKLRYKTTNETEYPYGYEQSEQLTKGKALDDDTDFREFREMKHGRSYGTADRKETFAIGPNNVRSGMPMRRWPSEKHPIPHLHAALDMYYDQMDRLSRRILRLFALAMNQSPDFFDDKMDHHMSALRLVHYYPIDPPLNQTEVVRAGAHTDYGAVTILNAHDRGLQILLYDDDNKTSSQWYPVPVVPDTLIINLGDLMQRWTNGT